MATWDKIDRATEDGRKVSMMAPVIVSASRSTDIPAFYADWFFKRLEKGYSVWTNPFNNARSYISYEKMRFVVLWSKNPEPLLEHLDKLKERKIGCYIQYTLNDYEREGMEKVPPIEKRIETFRKLVKKLGKGAVIWRFDPLILTDRITVDDLLERIAKIGDQLKGYTEKLVYSYADIAAYKKVKSNLDASGIKYKEWETEEMEEMARRLSEMNRERGWGYRIATCGEKIDTRKYGIEHNRCIDGDLIVRLAWEDTELMKSMKVKIEGPSLLGPSTMPEGAILLPDGRYFLSTHKKDQGQRQFCECMASKDIGEYNTCPHLCEYCDANTTKTIAIENWKRHLGNREGETITGK